MYHVGIGFLNPPAFSPGPDQVPGAPPAFRYDAVPDGTYVHRYQIVAVNILLEDTVPGPILTLPTSDTPNVTLFWVPVPGAVQYKILRDGLRLATVGATGSKDSVFTNFMSYKDTTSHSGGSAYTAVSANCQHLLPFQTTSVESWSPPSQA